MAHIQNRGKKRWRARYIGGDGREHNKTFTRKTDAERFLASMEMAKIRGEWIDPQLGRMPFELWAERWFGATATLKPKTIVGYESLLRTVILPAFAGARLARIQPVDVQEWIAQLTARGLSPSRIRQAYHLFGAIMRGAVQSGYVARSPCVGVRLPRSSHREMQFLSADEVRRLAEAMAEPFDVLVYVLAYGGLRWGEATALRRARCDLLHSRLLIRESLADVNGKLVFGPTKTYSERVVAIPGFLRDRLARHLDIQVGTDNDALVFTSRQGAPLRRSNWGRRYWIPALVHSGLPRDLRIHDLRHTYASLLVAQGAHVKVVQRHLGHSSPTVTLDTYAHLFPDDVDQVVDGLQRAYENSQTASPRPVVTPPSQGVEETHGEKGV